MYQKTIERGRNSRARSISLGERGPVRGTGKEYEFQCACVEGNKTIKSVLNHGTDNTHGAYPADPSDGFPFTTAEKPDRVHCVKPRMRSRGWAWRAQSKTRCEQERLPQGGPSFEPLVGALDSR